MICRSILIENTKLFSLIIVLFLSLVSCGDNETSIEKTGADLEHDVSKEKMTIQHEPVDLSHVVVYEETIYKNWPYQKEATTVEVTDIVVEAVEKVEAVAEEKVTEATAAAELQTHIINAEARVFKPDTVYINSGDTVQWRNMTSHNTVSVEGLIPEGAKHWRSKLGENLKITLDVEGIYAYVCEPHLGFGMVGIIVVGKPSNLDEVKAFAIENLKGPYRRLIGKLNKVMIQ